MKVRHVINSANMPARLPLFQSITAWLALDHWNAPGFVWGGVGVIFLVAWIACIVDILNTAEMGRLP